MALDKIAVLPAAKIDSTDGAYLLGKAQDVTVFGDGTGTPYRADLVNDDFGYKEALLAEAGLTPSNVPDTGLVSQYLDASKIVHGIVVDTPDDLLLQPTGLPVGTVGYTREDGKEGEWVVTTWTAEVDNEGTIKVDATWEAASKYWRRVHDDGAVFSEWFGVIRNDNTKRAVNTTALQAANAAATDIKFRMDTVYYFDDFQPANKPFNLIGGKLGDRDDEDENCVLDFSVATASYALNIDNTLPQAVNSSIRGLLLKCPTDKDCLFIDNVGISLYEVMIKAQICITAEGVTSQTWQDCIFMGATKAIFVDATPAFFSNNTVINCKAFTNYTTVQATDIAVHLKGTSGGVIQGNTWINLDMEQTATGLKTEGFVRDVFQGLWIEGASTKWIDEDGDADNRNVFLNPVFGLPSQTNTFSPNSKLDFGDNIRTRLVIKGITDNTIRLEEDVNETGNWLKPIQAKFRANLSATQTDINPASGDITVLFATEDYDDGSDFNTVTWTFSSPVGGVYHFDVKLRLDDTDTAASAYSLKLKVNGVTRLSDVKNPAILPGDGFMSISLSGDLKLTGGQSCIVTISQSGGTQQTDISASATETWFSGHLVG